MRTYMHRGQMFYNRGAISGTAILEKLGLTDEDRTQFIDLGPFMNIAPLSVQVGGGSEEIIVGGHRAHGKLHIVERTWKIEHG
jgi:hypothetical protein